MPLFLPCRKYRLRKEHLNRQGQNKHMEQKNTRAMWIVEINSLLRYFPYILLQKV